MKFSKFKLITFGVCFVPFMALASDTVDPEADNTLKKISGENFEKIPEEVVSNIILKNLTPQELTNLELTSRRTKFDVDKNYEHRYEGLIKFLVKWPYPIFKKERKDHGGKFLFSGKEEENRAETIKNLRSTVLLAELVKFLPQKTQEDLESTFPKIKTGKLFGSYNEKRKELNKALYQSLYKRWVSNKKFGIQEIRNPIALEEIMAFYFNSSTRKWVFSGHGSLGSVVYELFFPRIKFAKELSLDLSDNIAVDELQKLLNGKNSITTLNIGQYTKPELLIKLDLTNTKISSLRFRGVDILPQTIKEFKFPSQIKELYFVKYKKSRVYLSDLEGVLRILDEQGIGKKLDHFVLSISKKEPPSKSVMGILANFTKDIKSIHIDVGMMALEDYVTLAAVKEKKGNEKYIISGYGIGDYIEKLNEMERFKDVIDWK